MTQEEKDRLEVVKNVCSLQDCTLNEIYNFIKTDESVATINILGETLPDGIYFITEDNCAHIFPDITHYGNEPDIDNVVGVGIKQGDKSIIGALYNAAYDEDVTLTTHKDKKDYNGYITEHIDAVADWNGKTNTDHLKAENLNPAINLKNGWYIPSVAEMYLIYLHRKAINEALEYVGGSPIPGIWYWTSTEYSEAHAWGLSLCDGYLIWGTKTCSQRRVRPCRSIYS